MGVIVLFAVVNTMTMNVMERTNEIGTIRAMGVRRNGIRAQFVIEGWMLGAIAATVGVVLAFGVAAAINHCRHDLDCRPATLGRCRSVLPCRRISRRCCSAPGSDWCWWRRSPRCSPPTAPRACRWSTRCAMCEAAMCRRGRFMGGKAKIRRAVPAECAAFASQFGSAILQHIDVVIARSRCWHVIASPPSPPWRRRRSRSSPPPTRCAIRASRSAPPIR